MVSQDGVSRLRGLQSKIFLLVFVLFAAFLIVMCSPVPVLAGARRVEPLLTTRWGQRHPYNLFAPVNPTTGKHERLGCWSVAIAQILKHLRLQPYGYQHYKGDLYTIDEHFGHIFDWRLIADALNEHSSPEEVRETALFCYYIAVVVQKNFGTGRYMGNSDVIRAELHDHCHCTTRRVSTAHHTPREIESFISAELEQGRPLMLYVRPHAIVIDGYRVIRGDFEVHINFGWYGLCDGWYRLWGEIHTPIYTFTNPDRWIMAIRP